MMSIMIGSGRGVFVSGGGSVDLSGAANVKRYGATGDGDTDDLAAIHATRDVAGVNGVVFMPPGSYFVSAAIAPLAGQLWIGAGIQATKILVSNVVTNSVFVVSAADVTITDLQIDGQRGNAAVNLSTSQNNGVYVTAARCMIVNVWIKGVRSMGVQAHTDADDLHVLGCKIDGGHTDPAGTVGGVYKGVYVQGANRPVVRGCTITGWSQAIGLWFGVNDGIVEGNYILDNYGFEDAAHTVHRSATEDYGDTASPHGNNLWSNNIIDGSTSRCLEIAQGVVGSRFVNNVLRNPGILSNDGCCFEVTGQSGKITTDILIQGNVCYGQAAHADNNTVNSLAYRVTIANNHFIGYTHSGVVAPVFIGGLTGPQDIVITGNHFYNCRGGIRLNANGDGIIIANNNVRDAVAGTIIDVVSGGSHLISGNEIETNNATGINVAGSGKCRIIGNRVKTGQGAALQLSTPNNVAQSNELVNGNSANTGPLNITGASALRNKVTNNILQSTSARQAVSIISSADYNLVQQNTIDGGVYTTGGGSNNCTEPNHTASLVKLVTLKALGTQTVGTSQATIAHGLGYAPTVVQITMTGAGTIWKSSASDATNIYLTADDAGRTAEVFVR